MAREICEILSGMMEFAAKYCTDKCVRSMYAGMLIIAVIFLIRIYNKSGRAQINYYAMLLLLPMGFSGTNKLFYLSYMSYVSAVLGHYVTPAFGKFYFGVMFGLLARYIWKNRRLKKWVRALPAWEDGQLAEAVSFVEEEDRSGWQKRYLSRVKVYVTKEQISPFSGGLLHPYVVMPDRVLTEWPSEERRIALCHELSHLKSGHIFWMTWFQLLKIYWWINPLIHLCGRYFRDDMEMVCDEKCVRHAGVSCTAYGKALLGMIVLMQGTEAEGTLCFAGRNDFSKIKERIVNLSCMNDEQTDRAKSRRGTRILLTAAGLLFAVVAVTAYPKYTALDDLSLYNEKLQLLDDNSEELRGAVRVADGRLVIDQEKFRDILTKNNITDEYVYISFDCIMKLPGYGGCGNCGMIATADYDDIFYLAADGIEYELQRFWLKYLI